MASDESEALGNGVPDAGPDGIRLTDGSPPRAALGTYTWEDFKEEFFYEDGRPPTNWRGKARPFPAEEFLGFDPKETESRIEKGAKRANALASHFEAYLDPEETEVSLGNYLWEHFRYEHYYDPDREKPHEKPRDEDGNVIEFDKSEWLGFEEAELPERLFRGAFAGNRGSECFEAFLDPETTPVTVGEYLWEHFRYEYYYEPDREKPHEKPCDEDGNVIEFDKSEWLGFEEDDLTDLLTEGAAKANELLDVEDERTLDVPEALDEDAFFSTREGYTTVVNRYDLEKAVPLPKKSHFREVDRYWVNKPNSFVIIFHSEKENETKYYLIEPYRTRIEDDLREFLTGKLRSSIKYASDDVVVEAEEKDREAVIERETLRLLSRYDLYQLDDDEIAELLTELLTQYDSARDTWNRYSAETRAQTGEAIRSLREEAEPYLERFRKPEEEEKQGEQGEHTERKEKTEQTKEATDSDENEASETEIESGESDSISAESDEHSVEESEGKVSQTDAETTLPATTETELPAKTDEESLENADSAGRLGGLKGRWNDLLAEHVGDENLRRGVRTRIEELIEEHEVDDEEGELGGIMARPEPALLAEDADTLTEYQVEKLLYLLKRDFIGYERIDGVKHDINVEDISCDGYNSPVFVYHSDYEQIITNVHHGESELDDFVVKLAQRSGKGISKRQPQVDATLPDGSRAQLTLGREVSDHGTNYTIRQFKDVPFTPLDLINWNTFSLDEMAFLWLAIENHRSLIFAGGTASGKTTSLNAVSLFIPSSTKIVSIEDTREVELPQRNWIASVTRPSFSDDDRGDVDEFDLLEAALRQRPDYIVMGEIRGEEGRTLFQVMSTGHTTYTTFHADTVGEVLKRFTTEPINVSKTLFTALDLVSVQTQTRVNGSKVRRTKSLTEINHYDTENDEINVKDVFQWRAETDEHERLTGSNTLEEIKFDRGWTQERLESELHMRRTILAYLLDNGLNGYTQVAATIQAFINDPDTILALVANDELEGSLTDLREMESVLIDIEPKKEEMVPRPDPTEEVAQLSKDILAEAEDELFDQYREMQVGDDSLAVALADAAKSADEPIQNESVRADSNSLSGDDDRLRSDGRRDDDLRDHRDDNSHDDHPSSVLNDNPFGEFEEATVADDEEPESTGEGEE
ncbi:type II/IV secretion system ATPase subunit [Haladaptatus cibarius]|uniref:type II/IV secretion system ATPase subunit n=1 Tax=Haladaptatus cibarius TaxID=453847 RepID=UPI000B122A3B|nr:ATPase, T2SS/T4P/T4SS family [Haladaptatus cibarius]